MLPRSSNKPPKRRVNLKDMWSVIYFADAGANKTKVTVVGLGYGADEQSQKMRQFFAVGNDVTLQRLQKYFAAK